MYPSQDFGLSIDQCSKQIQPNLNIRFGIILREQIYYAGPVNNLGLDVPQGEYQVLLELYNENRATVACANATITCF
ncbi:Lymphocyte antigen 86 [Apodemus speciosus]|uniref:Lymphocyte antigen 86 n=1 Tax=Apodemus speciosus TaxID=105296 RepID=A0ABQ0FFR4_APOSI